LEESTVTWNTGLQMDEPLEPEDEETYILVAALAAALVAHQVGNDRPGRNGHRPPSRVNWRLMARWGQLSGYR
jgi:hypothetical protein